MSKPKILIIASFDRSLLNFRGDFISALVKNNFEVFCAAPEFQKKTVSALHALGVQTVAIQMESTGLNPIKDFKCILELKRVIKTHQIDLVFPYTIKPVIYGSIAARQLHVPVFSLITGLGFTFSGVSFKSKILQQITQLLYREGLRKNRVVIFQNRDDRALFLDKGIITPKQKTAVVDGSGINLERFTFRIHHKTKKDSIKFIIVARLIKEKGVALFMEAAKQLKPLYPLAEFHVVGAPPPNNSSGISVDILESLDKAKIIVSHGHLPNVLPVLSDADIFVLPSYYREGVPRSILEALSIGMPIITTQMPGCRETVVPEKNGFLIPPQELDPLIEAMEFFLTQPEQIAIMGKASRELAEQKFDVDIINQQLIGIIKDELFGK